MNTTLSMSTATRVRTPLLLALAASLVALSSGCAATEHFQYDSQADRAFTDGETQTTFDLVMDEDNSMNRPYSVFVAQDKGADPYVLLTPVNNPQTQSLQNARLSEGIPVALSDVSSMQESIRNLLVEWEELEEGSGETYEYDYAPEERTLGFHPRMLLSFSTYENGPSLVMNLGEYVSEEAINATATRTIVETAYSTRIDDREQIERLISLLGQAEREAR
jgi:hypothetical protein